MQSLWFSLWNIVRWLETSKDMRFCAFADRGIKNFSCWMKIKFLRYHKKMGVSRNFCDRGIWDFSSWIKMKFFWLELYRWSMKVGWCDERERMPQMWDTSFAIGSLSHFGGSLWTGDEFCEIYWWWKGKGEVSKYVGCFHWNQQCWFSIFYQWYFGDKLRLVHLRQIKSDEREKRLPQHSALRRQESNNKLSGHVRLSSSVLVVNIYATPLMKRIA